VERLDNQSPGFGLTLPLKIAFAAGARFVPILCHLFQKVPGKHHLPFSFDWLPESGIPHSFGTEGEK
jgi:hypothetical protein